MFYKGINLFEIILDVNSSERFSGSKRAYELFGDDLTQGFSEELPSAQWVSSIYNESSPHELYLIHNVDWSASEIIEAKRIASEINESIAASTLRKALGGLSVAESARVDESKDKDRFIVALERTKGAVTKACKNSGVSRKTFNRWMEIDPDFRDAVDFVANEIKDNIEFTLISNAEDGDINSIKYFMDARAKERGYGKIDKSSVADNDTELEDLDLSLLTYDEQCTLSELLTKAQPKRIEHDQRS